MTESRPTKEELELIAFILRMGSAVQKRFLEKKCESRKINYEKFIDKYKWLLSKKICRGEPCVTILDRDTATTYLAENGYPLISHHGQISRRKW
ncbi:MAG: hypothetical protein QXU18_13480 [Thermoplasmatales archaeon]